MVQGCHVRLSALFRRCSVRSGLARLQKARLRRRNRMIGHVISAAALACLTLVGPLPARAEEYGPDVNLLACDYLRDEIAKAEAQLNPARTNSFLYRAADQGCTSIVADLLDRGASVVARDRFANTALIHAAGAGHPEVVRLLLDRGSEIDHANLKGSTALAEAVVRRRPAVVDLLLKRGASTARRDPNAVPLLSAAAFNGDEEI